MSGARGACSEHSVSFGSVADTAVQPHASTVSFVMDDSLPLRPGPHGNDPLPRGRDPAMGDDTANDGDEPRSVAPQRLSAVAALLHRALPPPSLTS